MAIWSKGGDATNQLVHRFTVGEDWRYDRAVARYDLLGCIAHATMLGEVNLISPADTAALVKGLQQLSEDYENNAWTVEPTDEDVHSKIEALLTERLGEPGKKLHTGRSRNDQVLTATRLWLKDNIMTTAVQACETGLALIDKAIELEWTPLPGYTHLQRGMPSSCGQFFGAHAQALLDNLMLLEGPLHLADASPLGSGASYGSGLPLNRERTAELLGFNRPVGIAMRDANSRGKVECAALDAIGAFINDASRFAADMVFYTSAEAGFFVIGAGFTTGSSIMPQKKNLDLFELMRGRAASFGGLKTAAYNITCGLPSGYSRDLQDTKPHLIDGVEMGKEMLAVLSEAVPTLQPVEDNIRAALTQDIYATDETFRLVTEEGMSFRDAYVQVGNHLDHVPVPQSEAEHTEILQRRTHTGSTGKLNLQHWRSSFVKAKDHWQARQDALHATWQNLLEKKAGDGKRVLLGKPTEA